MKKPYRIVIAEDYRILREAGDGRDAIRCAEQLKPDLVLMDLSMPKMDGLDAIGEVKNQSPATKVLVLTIHKADEYIFESFKAGADGYLLKDATHAELKLAVENVLAGKPYVSPGVSGRLVTAYLEGRKPVKSVSSLEILTQRERQVLKLIAEGYKNKEIADFLCISVKTVEKHRANLMKKLDLHNASALTAFASEKGLIAK
jgi:DNA-binding NarL/FixJ family response regulator